MAITKDNSLTERLGQDCKLPISGNFQHIEGLDVLLQDIQSLLLTVPGERVARPGFGCQLRNQIWENLDTAAINGASSIRSAISTFEPRIKLTNVTYTINRNTDLIIFKISFIVISTNVAANLIFPFRSGTQLSLG